MGSNGSWPVMGSNCIVLTISLASRLITPPMYVYRPYALTDFIEHFNNRSTSVYVAFLDASKEFDKINHWLLKADRETTAIIFSSNKFILCYWYILSI